MIEKNFPQWLIHFEHPKEKFYKTDEFERISNVCLRPIRVAFGKYVQEHSEKRIQVKDSPMALKVAAGTAAALLFPVTAPLTVAGKQILKKSKTHKASYQNYIWDGYLKTPNRESAVDRKQIDNKYEIVNQLNIIGETSSAALFNLFEEKGFMVIRFASKRQLILIVEFVKSLEDTEEKMAYLYQLLLYLVSREADEKQMLEKIKFVLEPQRHDSKVEDEVELLLQIENSSPISDSLFNFKNIEKENEKLRTYLSVYAVLETLKNKNSAYCRARISSFLKMVQTNYDPFITLLAQNCSKQQYGIIFEILGNMNQLQETKTDSDNLIILKMLEIFFRTVLFDKLSTSQNIEKLFKEFWKYKKEFDLPHPGALSYILPLLNRQTQEIAKKTIPKETPNAIKREIHTALKSRVQVSQELNTVEKECVFPLSKKFSNEGSSLFTLEKFKKTN